MEFFLSQLHNLCLSIKFNPAESLYFPLLENIKINNNIKFNLFNFLFDFIFFTIFTVFTFFIIFIFSIFYYFYLIFLVFLLYFNTLINISII